MLKNAAKYHYIDTAFHKKLKLFQKLIEVNEKCASTDKFFIETS